MLHLSLLIYPNFTLTVREQLLGDKNVCINIKAMFVNK